MPPATTESAPAMQHAAVIHDEEIAGLQTEADAHRGIVQQAAELAMGGIEIRDRIGIEVDGADRAAVGGDRAAAAPRIELGERRGVTQAPRPRPARAGPTHSARDAPHSAASL